MSARLRSRRWPSTRPALSSPAPRPATRCRSPRPGWAEQDPEDWWRATRAGARGAGRRRGRRDRAERADARAGRARRGRRRDPPGDPVERRPHRGRVRGDRAADRPRRADRPHRQPGADRLHRAEAAVAAAPRARGVRAGSRGSRCPRTTCACGSAASTRPTWPTRPARCCSTSRGGAGARRCSARSSSIPPGCRGCSSRRRSPARPRDGIPVAAGAGDQAAGALGVGVDRPGPLSIALGTSGVVFASLPGFAADERARVHAFCHAVPGGWHAMGVMLSAAGSLQWLRDTVAARDRVRRAGRRGRGAGRPGPRG